MLPSLTRTDVLRPPPQLQTFSSSGKRWLKKQGKNYSNPYTPTLSTLLIRSFLGLKSITSREGVGTKVTTKPDRYNNERRVRSSPPEPSLITLVVSRPPSKRTRRYRKSHTTKGTRKRTKPACRDLPTKTNRKKNGGISVVRSVPTETLVAPWQHRRTPTSTLFLSHAPSHTSPNSLKKNEPPGGPPEGIHRCTRKQLARATCHYSHLSTPS